MILPVVSGRAARRFAVLLAFVATLSSAVSLDGHEGHAALPSSGAKVEGDRVLVSPEARLALGLTTAEATSGRLSRTVGANGSLAVPWTSRGFASSLVAGRVTEIAARPGDVVSAGAPLLVIESAELTTEQFDYLQAASERTLAERLLAQRRELAEGGVVATKELLAAETDVASRRAAEAIARRKLAALGLSAEAIDRLKTTQQPSGRVALTSPVAGRVAWMEARIGQMIDPLVHVAEVVEPEKLWAVVDVPETALREVKEGQRVDLFIGGSRDDATPTGRGRIAGFSAAVAEGRWMLPTIVELDEADPSQRAGMFGRVRIHAADVEDAVLVPLAAVGDATTHPFVLVEEQEGSYLKTP
ncbi:MAG TPA: efflux RND transporter periplasmic adaptor subunit, partial [Pirellulales bacterium]